MPYLSINGANIYYEISGKGTETIVFSHGLLWSGQMFHKQVAYFQENYRCVTYDHRGQGKSEVTKHGYDMDELYEDAVALIEALDLAPCHFVGLSMGGFIGMRLAARRPDLLRTLILMETSANEEAFKGKYKKLNFIAKLFGIGIVADKVMPIMFGQTFLNDPYRTGERNKWRKILADNKRSITKSVTGVITRKAVLEELKSIEMPTLILVGDEDVATPVSKAEEISHHIINSKLVVLEGAGHSSSIETPDQVNALIGDFIKAF